LLTARGIRVVAFVAGDVEDVIDAWQRHNLEVKGYAMPGRRGNRHPRSNRQQREEVPMGGYQGGGGRRGGRGQGGQGRCRQDPQQPNTPANATTQMCICTQCGHTETHERGKPCMQKKCSQCGALMSRQ
jgi:hypothetical protein